MNIIAGTGHRPNKLGGYDADTQERLIALAAASLKKFEPTAVISGMALGWDQALAVAAINLNIPFVAAIPFKGFEAKWPQASQDRYHYLVDRAVSAYIICEGGYHPGKMQTRNEWMVEHSDMLLALWDGSTGGTYNCIQYARKSEPKCVIVNVWPSWVKYKGVPA